MVEGGRRKRKYVPQKASKGRAFSFSLPRFRRLAPASIGGGGYIIPSVPSGLLFEAEGYLGHGESLVGMVDGYGIGGKAVDQ